VHQRDKEVDWNHPDKKLALERKKDSKVKKAGKVFILTS